MGESINTYRSHPSPSYEVSYGQSSVDYDDRYGANEEVYDDYASSPSTEKPSRRCCCRVICMWPVALTFFLCLVGAIACFWAFAPVDSFVGSILPDFEDPGTSAPTPSPTSAIPTLLPPTTSPVAVDDPGTGPSFQFIQCADDAAECCNGLESNCNTRVNELLFAASHNAMSSLEGGDPILYNHLLELEPSLDAGYRALLLDVCVCGGELVLCHGLCGVGRRNMTEVFTSVVTFLDDHPTELIILIFQISVGTAEITALYDVMQGVSGFVDYLYVKDDTTTPWPRMRNLIQDNTRIIAFHHDGSDCSNNECPAGLHYYFDYAVETPFEFNNPTEIAEYTTSCQFDRGVQGNQDFFGINHFVTPPAESSGAVLNTESSLTNRLTACFALTGRTPSFIAVDFWSLGVLPEFVQTTNAAATASNIDN